MTNYAITVAIPETIAAQAGPEKLGEVASALLTMIGNGGFILPPEWAERLRSAIGTLTPQDVVERVERTAKRSGGNIIVEWVVDPSQIEFYRMQAESNGLTLEQQLKTLLDYAYSQGWFGSTAPDPFKLLLTESQYQILQRIFNKDIVTGADVMEALEVRQSKAATPEDTRAEEEEDILLAALEG